MNRQLPIVHLTKRNPITDIPYLQRRTLCAKLDSYDDWKKFVGYIKSKDGHTPRYSDLHMCLFDREKERKYGSPTEAVLNDWKTLRPTIGELFELLVSVDLKDAANFISTEVLREGPLKEPVEVDVMGSRPYVPSRPSSSMPESSFSPAVPIRPLSHGPPSVLPPELTPEGPSITEHPYRSILDDDTAKSLADYLSSQPEPIPVYSYSDLQIYTSDFNSDHLDNGGRFLGKGGYGEVYLGTIKTPEKTEMVAVKRFHESSLEYLNQFKTELEVIFMNCHHPNLLSIKGICKERSFCVVYEYMGNGTLEQRLSSNSDKSPLTAEKRLSIAIDVARGIDRLHNGVAPGKSVPIVHRDVKPANILLDDNLNAKLGDYGLVRVQEMQNSSYTNVTTNVHGSRYYMPPEATTGYISPKWDVYSFGVVLLELLFAKGPEMKDENGISEKMIECLFDDDFEGDPLTLLDPKCNWNPTVADEILRLVERCGLKWKKRPAISGSENSVLETLIRIEEHSKRMSR